MAVSYSETPFERIVAVGWSGRFGFINLSELDAGDPLNVIYATERTVPFLPPAVFGGVRTVGDAIDFTPWNGDSTLDGILSIDVSGSLYHGQVVNFRRLESGGGSPAGSPPAVTGKVGGSTFVFSASHSYSAELKIFTGGVVTVSGITATGRYPIFTLTGGTVHYAGTRTWTMDAILEGIFHTFNEDGFI